MLKLISMKTIGTTAVSLALLAGTLATPAFAKSNSGYIKPAVTSNRGYSELGRTSQRHYGGFKIVGVKETKVRFGSGFFDVRIEYNKLNNVSGN